MKVCRACGAPDEGGDPPCCPERSMNEVIEQRGSTPATLDADKRTEEWVREELR